MSEVRKMLFRIAIVEDEKHDSDLLERYIARYFAEDCSDASYHVTTFNNPVSFVEHYKSDYDLILLDIQMPGMNGMDVATALRKKDSSVLLIFVTNMAQYAVKGYDVNAAGFILKPVSYYDLLMRIRKCITILQSRTEECLTLKMKQGIVRLPIRSILYIEVNRHMLTYHTSKEALQATGSLSELEAALQGYNFLRCNSCYLVNPRAIQAVLGYDIHLINGEQILISHPKRKQFMQELNIWLREGKNL